MSFLITLEIQRVRADRATIVGLSPFHDSWSERLSELAAIRGPRAGHEAVMYARTLYDRSDIKSWGRGPPIGASPDVNGGTTSCQHGSNVPAQPPAAHQYAHHDPFLDAHPILATNCLPDLPARNHAVEFCSDHDAIDAVAPVAAVLCNVLLSCARCA